MRHGRHIAGIQLEDASVAGSRRVEIFPEQSQVAQAAESFDVIGDELQDPLARCGGFIVFPFLDADLGQGDQRAAETSGSRDRRVRG